MEKDEVLHSLGKTSWHPCWNAEIIKTQWPVRTCTRKPSHAHTHACTFTSELYAGNAMEATVCVLLSVTHKVAIVACCVWVKEWGYWAFRADVSNTRMDLWKRQHSVQRLMHRVIPCSHYDNSLLLKIVSDLERIWRKLCGWNTLTQ